MNRDDELNPLHHPERWERLVASIVAAGEPDLAARRTRPGLAAVVAGWARPALSAAATVLLLVAGAAVAVSQGGDAGEETTSLATSLVPEAYAAWLVADYEPTVAELVLALDEVGR